MENKLNKALFAAVSKGNIVHIKKHLKAGADVNARDDEGNTPLHIIMMLSDIDFIIRIKIFSLLLDYGGNIETPNDAGNTPADYAIGRMV